MASEHGPKNVSMELVDQFLIIRIDMSKERVASESGKSKIIASTHGFLDVAGAERVALNLNLIERRKKA